ncbi:MAG: aspartyl protease family protein [Candidatus Eisenbacteria bacterium]|nr:aspartyl protease family protein [Candidatus Eisenbacteria bacterium]
MTPISSFFAHPARPGRGSRPRRCLAAALALVALAFSAPRTGRASEPLDERQVLARWLAALGGSAAVESVRVTYVWARIEGAGLRGRSEEWNTARGELRSVADFNTFRRITGYDGARGYVVDENRKVRELTGTALANLRTEVYLASYSPFFPGRVPGSIRYLGEETIAGARFHTLEAHAEGGHPVRVYLDAGTFLPARIRRVDDTDTSWTLYQNYRAVDGVMDAFLLRGVAPAGGDTTRFVVEALLHPKQPPSPGLFDMPPDTLRDYVFAGGADSAEVAVESWGEHLVVRAASHGDAGLPFLLDTGAEASNLEASLARRWRLASRAPLQIRGTGGTEDASLVALDTLRFGGVALLSQHVAAVNLSGVRPTDRRLAGVLGYDFFSRFVVKLDFERSVMTLYAPHRAPVAAGVVIPIALDTFVPRVEAVVNDTLKARLQVDTGAPASVVFFRGYWSTRTVLEERAPRREIETAGLGGRAKSIEATFASLALGPYRVEKPLGMFRQSEAGATRSREDAGLLGMGFLRRFQLVLDYGQRRMMLRPNASYQAAPRP